MSSQMQTKSQRNHNVFDSEYHEVVTMDILTYVLRVQRRTYHFVVGEVAIIYMEDCQLNAKHKDFPELNERPDNIMFTNEEAEVNQLAVLVFELNVNQKRKKIEFNVH